MRQPLQTGRCVARPDAGFTLIEVVITASVLFIGLLAMTTTSFVVHSLRGTAEDKQIAQHGLQEVVEDLFALSSASSEADAGWAPSVLAAFGPGGNPGPNFAIRGLDPWPGEASVGTIEIITDETRTDAEIGLPLGMPRDLNADGRVDDANVSMDAVLLPAIVRVRWRGSAGQRQLVQSVYLLQY